MSQAARARALMDLLPPGVFDPSRTDSNMAKVMGAVAGELGAADDRAAELAGGLFPATAAAEGVRAWAAVLDLDQEGLSTEDVRRAALLQLRKTGGANRSFYQGILNSLGFADDPGRVLPVCRWATCDSECDAPLWQDPTFRDTFVVFLPHLVQGFACDSRCNDFLAVFGEFATCLDTCNDFLVTYQSAAVLRQFIEAKPAHAVVLFYYY